MKRLYRDRWDRKIAGVCGGLGQYLEIDSTIIRLLVVTICIFTAILPLLILYILAWMLIPLGSPVYIQYKCKKLYRSINNRKIGGVCGGIAEMLHVHATAVRVIALSLMIVTGVFPLLVTYIVGVAIIPEDPRWRSINQR